MKFRKCLLSFDSESYVILSPTHEANIKIYNYITIILHVVLYGYKTWSFKLKEEHRMMAFQIRGPKNTWLKFKEFWFWYTVRTETLDTVQHLKLKTLTTTVNLSTLRWNEENGITHADRPVKKSESRDWD